MQFFGLCTRPLPSFSLNERETCKLVRYCNRARLAATKASRQVLLKAHQLFELEYEVLENDGDKAEILQLFWCCSTMSVILLPGISRIRLRRSLKSVRTDIKTSCGCYTTKSTTRSTNHVMPHCDGGNLNRYIKDCKRRQDRPTIPILADRRQILTGEVSLQVVQCRVLITETVTNVMVR